MPYQPSLDTTSITPPSESDDSLSGDPAIIRPNSRGTASTAASSPVDAYASAASEAEGEEMETPTQSHTQPESDEQVQQVGRPLESAMRHKSTSSTATLHLGPISSGSSSSGSSVSRPGKEARVVSPPPESVAGSSTSSSTTISRRASRRKSKSSIALSGLNPEQGWDEYTEANGNVMDFRTEMEVQRRLTYTEKVISQEMGSAAQGNWSFTKVFVDGSFMASGYLYIPKGGKKESKSVRDNTYIFHVLDGAVNVRIHMTSFILASGGTFMVPRGNVYYIENISDRPAKLMFVQAREMTVNETEDPLRLVRGQQQRHLAAVQVDEVPPIALVMVLADIDASGFTSERAQSIRRFLCFGNTGQESRTFEIASPEI
ncbi:hypothetical protein D9758_000978 [Tetrapyrgos nigripes]|uniref:CENP-C homolog n=1 Tax=Tetrapyrgos nigripes TaxID=182062 RepID=A0A8H5GZD5_9AGAR|nr:hypothetical protein D9758_000978 [Tetrapyrgos nigripes]